MSNYKLLGVGTNAKTIKGDGSEYLTAILYMSPAQSIEGINLCPMAEMAGCAKACLYTAGRGAMNCVQAARTRKAVMYRDDRAGFFRTLQKDLIKFQAYCQKRGIQPVVRLNGTSDINFTTTAMSFPEIQFYDYTKVYNRVTKDRPSNYHLTLSYSEANMHYAKEIMQHAIDNNVNVAVVFRSEGVIPKRFKGLPVVNGDADDLRFLDPNNEPHVVALYAKGKAKKDTSGFVID